MNNDEATNKDTEAEAAQMKIRELEAKLARLQKDRAVYAVKSRLLGDELEHYRSREAREHSLVDDLLERQRELNVMLNRSNILLARAQDATAMLSLEFGELARALPETVQAEDAGQPEAAKINERVQKINDLFRKTGELADELKETLHSNAEAQRRASSPRGPDGESVTPAATPAPEPIRQPESQAKEPESAAAQSAPSPEPPSEDSKIIQPPTNGAVKVTVEGDDLKSARSAVFESWAARTAAAEEHTPPTLVEEIASEQERADIEAALTQQGIWRKLRGKFSK